MNITSGALLKREKFVVSLRKEKK